MGVIVVDTSVLIDNLRADPDAVVALDRARDDRNQVVASVITKAELLAGMRLCEPRTTYALDVIDWVAVSEEIADLGARWHAGTARRTRASACRTTSSPPPPSTWARAVDPQPAPLPDVPGPAAALLMAAVTVVGAGVSGLTTALRLAEAGHDVTVVARDRPADTTSAVAAAVVPLPGAALRPGAGVVGDRLHGLRPPGGRPPRVRRPPALGHGAAAPGARRRVVGTGRARPGRHPHVPPGYTAGWRFRALVVDMGRYLPWLAAEAAAAGVTLVPEAVEVRDPGRAGRARGRLRRPRRPGPGPRSHRHPVRGQVVVTDPVGVEEWVSDDLDERTLTYVIPRIDDVVVGGTAEEGAWGTEPDPAVADAILARAAALVPALAGATVRAHKVGLRLSRPSVRLEAERRGRQTIVHNYGHGGAGVTLSWPCADEVVALVSGP